MLAKEGIVALRRAKRRNMERCVIAICYTMENVFFYSRRSTNWKWRNEYSVTGPASGSLCKLESGFRA